MITPKLKENLYRIAVIGNYLPRQCGIATFTKDLCDALAMEAGDDRTVASVAMDDVDQGYPYPDRVKFQLRDNRLPEYLRTAEHLNVNQFDVVILQHEFGIFGGSHGAHIIRLIKNLRMPLITTLHTVLKEPQEEMKAITQEIARYSEKIVVMSRMGVGMLRDAYKIPEDKIVFIPHGIPDVGFVDPCFHKDTFGVEDRKVILSFGLLHPGKGYEYVIHGMEEVVKKYPDAVYIILGASHPNVKASGDSYRQSLHQLVKRLKLEDNVQFKNQFVDLDVLCQFIGAADIYITPYLAREQIVSGTLAYTVGAGKAVISTPYWYAEELLAENRGVLVPFKNSGAIAREVIALLESEPERNALRKRAYQFGRSMIWKEVAREYLSVAHKVLENLRKTPKARLFEVPLSETVDELPEVNLSHLRVMTDGTGMLQHAVYSVPDREHGYCTDDNTRALIAVSLYYSLYKDESVLPLFHTYLSFLLDAFNREKGRFRNFMSYERKWLEDVGSEDSHGRALWGLGFVVKHAPTDSIRHMAARLFMNALPVADSLAAPRAWAFSLVGMHAYLAVYGGDAKVRRLRDKLAKKLYSCFKKNSDKDWPWLEDIVTYDNGKLPHALILSGKWLPDAKMYETGISLLKWLLKIQTSPKGDITIIGNSGWHTRKGKRSSFDQQPLEAMSLLDACAEAYRTSNEKFWLMEARRSLNWFLGRNDLNVFLYDFKSGGCLDGLETNGANANQGAESTLSWLISLLTLSEIEEKEVTKKLG